MGSCQIQSIKAIVTTNSSRAREWPAYRLLLPFGSGDAKPSPSNASPRPVGEGVSKVDCRASGNMSCPICSMSTYGGGCPLYSERTAEVAVAAKPLPCSKTIQAFHTGTVFQNLNKQIVAYQHAQTCVSTRKQTIHQALEPVIKKNEKVVTSE